jgi:hypothetical protein
MPLQERPMTGIPHPYQNAPRPPNVPNNFQIKSAIPQQFF